MNDARTPSQESGGQAFQPGGRAFQPGGRAFQPASFIPLHCALDDITIKVDSANPPPPTPAMLERWSRACQANPRLFNGPILRYISHSCPLSRAPWERVGERALPALPPPCHITARHDTYQRYAMQADDAAKTDPAKSVYHLAVTGIVTARDAHGNESVLLGKRGTSTFIYPDMWEHAPSGGLETADIYDQLLREMEEELGLQGLVDGTSRDALLEPQGEHDVLGLTVDPNTPSVDVVLRLQLRNDAKHALGAASWEYGSTRFVPVAELAAFTEQEGQDTIIPPALATWRGLGWVESSKRQT